MQHRKHVRFGMTIFGDGGNHTSWRGPSVTPGSSVDFCHYVALAQRAEMAKLDFLFIVDFSHMDPESPPHLLNQFEPMTLLGALSAVTSRIGLVATGSTSFVDPFTIARQFASLDLLSGGRAGWNLVTSGREGAALNFSATEHMPHDERYVKASEHLEVVRGLWDSWEDDAFLYDVARNIYYDREKLHVLGHSGRYFSVKGPLPIQRSPQGQPVVFQAGLSEAGLAFSAAHCDAIFSNVKEFVEAKRLYGDIKSRISAAGRDPLSVSVLAGAYFLVGESEEDAQRQYSQLQSEVSVESALKLVGRVFGYHDFSQYELDASFPDLGDLGSNGHQSSTDAIKRMAREERLTLREVALRYATPKSDFVGTAHQVADRIEQWMTEEACDGFILYGIPDMLNLNALVKVLPLLAARGLFRTEYEGTTLRSHLGLPFAENRYAAARKQV